ncbi:hypothetical protein FGO68_gene15518 [Halteria grandinella]|uniref:Uncharacterized protein n=1 Tax=Halteria grandinella TaxID=5974 RepID=A0A8J8T8H2_HALGN|nr:hypothetical protein FGO68_gene15518 [Halteria grandinella]
MLLINFQYIFALCNKALYTLIFKDIYIHISNKSNLYKCYNRSILHSLKSSFDYDILRIIQLFAKVVKD